MIAGESQKAWLEHNAAVQAAETFLSGLFGFFIACFRCFLSKIYWVSYSLLPSKHSS